MERPSPLLEGNSVTLGARRRRSRRRRHLLRAERVAFLR